MAGMIEEKGDELADIFIGLPSSVRSRQDLVDRKNYLTSKDDTCLPWQVSRIFDEAQRIVPSLKKVNKRLALLRRRRAELTEEEFKADDAISRDRKEINRLIRTGIDDVSNSDR